MTDKSLGALIGFLDWTAEKGLMPKNTVGGRKAAASSVLGVLTPEETADVTTVDLDRTMARFINLQGKRYNTSSLNVYKSRTNAAIKDFQRWLNDPLAFKPQASKMEKKPSASGSKSRKPASVSDTQQEHYQSHSPSPPAQAPTNVFPIQIRENLVVRIHNLPFDLSPAEAEKIANVVKALAMN